MKSTFLLGAALFMALIFTLHTTAPARAIGPEDLTYLTENYYPYNFSDGTTVKGILPDIIREMWKVMGVKEQPFHLYPWARAYDMIQNDPHTVLFGMARSPERETLFKWVGPISVDRFMLFAKNGRRSPLTLDGLDGATIGTVRDDIGDQIITGIKTKAKIQRVADIRINLRKIMDDRIDYLVHDEICLHMLLKDLNMPKDTLVPVLTLREIPSYIAVSATVPDELVARMNKALQQVRNSPAYDEIFHQYMQ